MTDSEPTKFNFLSDAFNIAQLLWVDLKRYNGLAMGCAESKDALTIEWQCYDSEFFPEPPSLDQTFERIIVDEYLERIKGFDSRVEWLKMVRFFTNIGGQVLIKAEKDSFLRSANLIQMLETAGFTQCKIFSEGIVYAYNV